MAEDSTVTAADIARLAGVGRAAVSNWRKRHDDFPRPIGGTAASPTFSLADVQLWLQGQGKVNESTSDEFLWQDLRRLADAVDLAEVLGIAGAFLLLLHRDPAVWAPLAKLTDKQLAARLPSAVGVGFPSKLAVEHIPIVRRLADLAAQRGPRDTFEFFRERYLDLHKRRAYETPVAVTSLVARLAGPSVETVLDPACGSGGFLLSVLDHAEPSRLLGQDIDADLARLTTARLALRTEAADIRAGDSLREDAFPSVEADLVATAPPFNDRNWGYDELNTDLRWEYGLPPRTEPELAWVQHALSHARPGGLAIVLMPPAAASRRAGRRIRQQLLRRGALRAVIGLPLGAVPNMAVPLALWVLRRPLQGERLPSQVLMVETSDDFVTQARDAWHRFSIAAEADLDHPGLAKAVRIIDLLDEEVDLTPSRHLTQPVAAPAIERVTERRTEVLDLLRMLPDLLPDVEAASEDQNVQLLSIAELARVGHLAVHQVKPDADPVSLRLGDVVVPSVIRTPSATVATESDTVLGRHHILLRPDPELLDPDYLAGVLRSSLNLRHYSAVSSSYRVDIRRSEIPLPPIDVQRGLGEVFRRLHAFSSGLRRAADLGGDLSVLINDALVDSSLKPADRGRRGR